MSLSLSLLSWGFFCFVLFFLKGEGNNLTIQEWELKQLIHLKYPAWFLEHKILNTCQHACQPCSRGPIWYQTSSSSPHCLKSYPGFLQPFFCKLNPNTFSQTFSNIVRFLSKCLLHVSFRVKNNNQSCHSYHLGNPKFALSLTFYLSHPWSIIPDES